MQNPLYAGLIKASWLDDLLTASHAPIVSTHVFFQAQQYLFRRKQAKAVKHVRVNPDFPLRGLLFCPYCHKKLTGAFSTGKSGNKFGYYFCQDRSCSVNLRKEWVEDEFMKLLNTISLQPTRLEPLLSIVRNVWEKKHFDTTSTRKLVEKKVDALKAKRKRLIELLTDGTLDRGTYKEQSALIDEEIAVISSSMDNENKKASIDIEACITWCREVLVDIADFWATAPHEQGVRTLGLIFPLGLRGDKAGFRTPVNSILFQYLNAILHPENNLFSPGKYANIPLRVAPGTSPVCCRDKTSVF